MNRRLQRPATFLLWLLLCVTFTTEFFKIIFELSPESGHRPLGVANAFFWSSLLLIEIVMAGLVVNAIIKHPARRRRLIVLSVCHFSAIVMLPMVLNDWSWTCLLYPWPHSLQAFDTGTPAVAMVLSAVIGFVIVPIITLQWGARAFCGYLCPHGAFFSETYGRLFPVRHSSYAAIRIGRWIPSFYFFLMLGALLAIALVPGTLEPLRTSQKFTYFLTAEFFYFVIGVPLLGGRSYCTLVCPMGYYVRMLAKTGGKLKKKKAEHLHHRLAK